MIDAPHKDAQDRLARSKHLHLLLHEVLLFRLGLGGQVRGSRVTEGSHGRALAAAAGDLAGWSKQAVTLLLLLLRLN